MDGRIGRPRENEVPCSAMAVVLGNTSIFIAGFPSPPSPPSYNEA